MIKKLIVLFALTLSLLALAATASATLQPVAYEKTFGAITGYKVVSPSTSQPFTPLLTHDVTSIELVLARTGKVSNLQLTITANEQTILTQAISVNFIRTTYKNNPAFAVIEYQIPTITVNEDVTYTLSLSCTGKSLLWAYNTNGDLQFANILMVDAP